MIPCQVTTFYQIGTKNPESLTSSHVIALPKKWKGTVNMTIPIMDLSLNGKLVVSSNYQAVHFGAAITIRNIPLEHSDDYFRDMKTQLKEQLERMEPDADGMLQDLLETANSR